jgi:geranylgeranyl reductase family protein
VDADVLIVGAGPAGASAALELAGSARVVLVERRRLPREKLCSGVLTPKALCQVEGRIDVPIIGESWRTWVGRNAPTVEAPYYVQFPHVPPLLFTSRARFDLALVEAAAARGAEVIDGAPVSAVDPLAGTVTLSDGRRLSARVIIGADGAPSVCRAAINSGPFVRGFAVEARVADPRGSCDRPTIIDFGIPRGYLWAFPKADGTVAVGGGTMLPAMPDLLPTVRAFASRVLGATLPRSVPGHLIPYRVARRVQHGRLLLAGDAAGLVDPLLGEGIPYALWSGRIAARVALRHLYGGEPLGAYAVALRHEVGRFTRWLRLASHAVPVLPPLLERVGRNAVARQVLWQYLIGRTPEPGIMSWHRPQEQAADRASTGVQ